MNPSLEAAQLACVRGDRRLFGDVSLTVEEGALLYVAGPNGSGKTTLLRMLVGLVRPEDGQVRWCGEPIRTLGEEYFRQVAYVGHHNAIKEDLTGRENLAVSLALDGLAVDDQQLTGALDKIGLGRYAELPVRALSQGQRRRVALARLLLTDAKLWVLDEPFVALDVAAVETLQETIRGHLERGGLTVLTTHQEVPLVGVSVSRLQMGETR